MLPPLDFAESLVEVLDDCIFVDDDVVKVCEQNDVTQWWLEKKDRNKRKLR